MKPYFGAINDLGQWFDGTDWRKMEKAEEGGFVFSLEDTLRQLETLRQHDIDNCHPDGVFTCPRCRKQHYIPDNFDYLCDGCVSALLVHPMCPPNALIGIKEWRAKGRAHPDVIERYAERDRLLLELEG